MTPFRYVYATLYLLYMQCTVQPCNLPRCADYPWLADFIIAYAALPLLLHLPTVSQYRVLRLITITISRITIIVSIG